MNKLLLLIAILSFNISKAQDNQIPTNEKTGNAEYVDVVNVEGASDSLLYERALAWINEFYPNPSGTIDSQDTLAREISCKARFRIMFTDKKGNKSLGGHVAYNMTLQFKNGKYRYLVDRIRWEKPSYYDVSRWENKEDPEYQEERYEQYVEQTVNYFNGLIDSLEERMATAEEAESTDW